MSEYVSGRYGNDQQYNMNAGLPVGIFQQDNDRPQTARVLQECYRHIITLPWLGPSRSLPPIKPAGIIWDCRLEKLLEPRLQELGNKMMQDTATCMHLCPSVSHPAFKLAVAQQDTEFSYNVTIHLL